MLNFLLCPSLQRQKRVAIAGQHGDPGAAALEAILKLIGQFETSFCL